MDLELQCIKQKTSALIRAYIGHYPITPTNKKLLQKMTSVLPVRLVLFRVFLKNSDTIRLERQKPYSSNFFEFIIQLVISRYSLIFRCFVDFLSFQNLVDYPFVHLVFLSGP